MKILILILCLSITTVGFGKEAQALSGGSAIHWSNFSGALEGAKKVVIYFGTPERRQNDLKPSEPTLIINDFEFYQKPLEVSPEYQSQLTALVCNPASFSEYRGMKFCGGFRPNVCIEWQFESEGQQWHSRAFACLGCHEWRLIDTFSAVHTDMTQSAQEEIVRITQALKAKWAK
jgi:hypothetical protein